MKNSVRAFLPQPNDFSPKRFQEIQNPSKFLESDPLPQNRMILQENQFYCTSLLLNCSFKTQNAPFQIKPNNSKTIILFMNAVIIIK